MLKLNLGCGQYRAPRGWINIDHPSAESDLSIEADVYCDIADMPFRDSSASRMYAGHVIEHLSEADLYTVFMELDRVLGPDGKLMIVGPDMDRINAMGDDAPEWLLKAMQLGNEGREGEHHLWQPSEASVLSLLEHEGFDARAVDLATIANDGWPLVAYTDWQFAIEATC